MPRPLLYPDFHFHPSKRRSRRALRTEWKGTTLTQQAMQVSKQGLENFQDIRFGMFIHWGLYSILAKQEWVMHTDRIPVPEYEKLVPQFNPVKFNADEWV